MLEVLDAAFRRSRSALAVLTVAGGLGACSNLLDIDLPGRIPSEQIDDPALAPTLVAGVVGDFECAYNNYTGGTAVHSDEFETSNGNVPLANWGERSIGADEDDYAVGGCDNSGTYFSDFGLHVPMQTARFQGEDVFNRLSNWTDEQVADRGSLMATARAYTGYTYILFGETYCSIAFDGGPEQTPAQSLAIAVDRLTEAATLAQQAGNTDILNLARVGLARAYMDLKQWANAATQAALVTPGYVKFADRGVETDHRWNKLHFLATENGAYVVGIPYRTMNDPRVMVLDTHGPAFTPSVDLWINTKYTDRGSPIRLASYKEAQLILAEAQAQNNQVAEAEQTINTYRATYSLPPLSFANQTDAVTKILEERRRELSFEGGQRLNDLLRYHLPWKGANGSTVNANPFSGRPYGQTTCWPLPTKEKNGA
jgi:hypothetical protein